MQKDPKEVSNLTDHIFNSSSLAVALEFLGELNEEQMAYSKTRGGTERIYFNHENGEISILSVRDMLSLLPD